jgi:hypothetical protein
MIRFEKKHKYLMHAALVTLAVFFFAVRFDFRWAIMAIAITLVGTFVVQYPNNRPIHFIINNLLPTHLIIGALLSLYYFPNLGTPVRILFVISMGLGFYIVSLINNVYLVIEEKKELIPLYRVAVTWSQIIFVVITIPFFAGVFKIPVSSLIQNSIVSISALLFAAYLFWIMGFDPEVKKVRGVEYLLLSLFGAFSVLVAGLITSFIPTESFLRALFISSVLMFILNYLSTYLKNSITKKSVIDYVLITFVFFAFLIIFGNS